MTTQTDGITDGIAVLLSNRTFLYRLMQRIFAAEPTAELLEIVTGEHIVEALHLLEEDEQLFAAYEELFEQLKQELGADPEKTLDKLRDEYTRLMIGPGRLPAPPWESVYTSKERLLFQESTLAVRRAYLEYNFLPAQYPHEADDHLSLELDFMAHLAQMAVERFEQGSQEELRKILNDQVKFLQEHLLVWIGDFAEKIQNSPTHHFYPQMAALTAQLLKLDLALIQEILRLV